jgi:lactate dehydrogenase-like 2-hydroxyacid dehydrogenase
MKVREKVRKFADIAKGVHISYYQYQPLKANKKTLSFKYIQVLFYVAYIKDLDCILVPLNLVIILHCILVPP